MDGFPHNLAIIIGINDYINNIVELKTARSDAEKLASLLETDYAYQARLITDATNQRPTLANLKSLLTQWLPTKLQSPANQNRLLFYFAGHGMALESDNGPRGFLLPQNADPQDPSTFLSMRELHDALIALPCHHVLVILDCCFAGTFRWSSTRKLIPVPETIHRQHYERFIRYPAWQVITSSAYDQEALDFLSDKRGQGKTAGHSPFAEALFDALQDGEPDDQGRRYKRADYTKDRVITTPELYLYLRDHLETRSGERQTPGFFPLNRHDRGEFIFHNPDFDPNDLSEAPELNPENNPYRGLQPFDEQHARFFFGRQALIEELYARVLPPEQRLTAVVGVSGSGKSSLVKAGLIPYLRHHTQHQWHILPPFRPGESPFEALAQCLSSIAPPLQTTVPTPLSQQLQYNPQFLVEVIQGWADRTPDTTLILVIDQFEELMTLVQSSPPQQSNLQLKFLHLLEATLATNLPQFRLVLTVRSDFEPRLLDLEILKPYWAKARYPVRPMGTEELRQAITGPASEAALYFEPANVVDHLVDEVGQMPGALPLLSFTLSEMYIALATRWRQQETQDRALTIDAHFEVEGGVIGSLTRRANTEYQHIESAPDLGEAGQQTLRRIMLRMLTLEGGEIARRRVTDSELVYPTVQETGRVQIIINRLVEARLLVRGQLNTGEPYVEPAHDFLVQSWGKLQDWIQAEKLAETLDLQHLLRVQANDWDNHHQAIGLLVLPGERLNRLENYLSDPTQDLWWNDREKRFVEASIAHRDRLEQQSQEQKLKTRLLESAQKVETLLPRSPLEAALLAIQSMGENLKLMPDNLLAATQYALFQSLERGGIYRTLLPAKAETLTIAISHDGKTIVSGSRNGTVSLWNRTGQVQAHLLEDHPYEIHSVAISADGSTVASADETGQIRLWSQSGQLLQEPFLSHQDGVNHLAMGADGQIIVSGGADGTVNIYDRSGQLLCPPCRGHGSEVNHVAMSAETNMIASCSRDKTVRLWSMAGESLGEPFAGHDGNVYSVDISADGQTIVSGGDDGKVIIWNQQGDVIATPLADHSAIPGYKCEIYSVALSADGKTIASAGFDGTVSGGFDNVLRLWDAQGNAIKSLPIDQGDATVAVAMNQDATTLVSLNYDESILIWDNQTALKQPGLNVDDDLCTIYEESGIIKFVDLGCTVDRNGPTGTSFRCTLQFMDQLGNRQSLPEFTGEAITALHANYDGDLIAVAEGFGKLRLLNWNGKALGPVINTEPTGTLYSLASSKDGNTIVAGASGVNKTETALLIFDKAGRLKAPPGYGHTLWIYAVAISRDGTMIASGGHEGTVRLWTHEGQATAPPCVGHEGEVWSVAIDATGHTIVSGGADKTVRLWDRKGQPIGSPFTGHEDAVRAVAISHDGTVIVSGSSDKTVRIWNRNGDLLAPPLPHPSVVNSVFISADKQVIATKSENKIYLWQGHWQTWLKIVCHRLQSHPAFINPVDTLPPELQKTATSACQVCQKTRF